MIEIDQPPETTDYGDNSISELVVGVLAQFELDWFSWTIYFPSFEHLDLKTNRNLLAKLTRQIPFHWNCILSLAILRSYCPRWSEFHQDACDFHTRIQDMSPSMKSWSIIRMVSCVRDGVVLGNAVDFTHFSWQAPANRAFWAPNQQSLGSPAWRALKHPVS